MALKKKIDNDNFDNIFEDKLIKNKLKNYENKQEKKNKPCKKENIVCSIRMPGDYKEILEKHFIDNGLSFSTGVRMVLYQYMKKKKII